MSARADFLSLALASGLRRGCPAWCRAEVAACRLEVRVESAAGWPVYRGKRRTARAEFLVTERASGDFLAWWTPAQARQWRRMMEGGAQ
ncbi:MAG TPA: hypothetical protein PK490_19750 [Prosthecobacter sp.]|nr:hypothetical protein [Prosthecobacter sp.]